VPLGPRDLGALGKGGEKRHLLLLAHIGDRQGQGTVDRPHQDVHIFPVDQFLGGRQADIDLELAVPGGEDDLAAQNAAGGIDLVDLQFEAPGPIA
jgi:hypothetical protein